ncbi:MAG: S8 family serine peptidase [Candidatus Brocadiales bacterium]|nr:S8 family serine peptidase [Candidatus Brocadiales bacterium]
MLIEDLPRGVPTTRNDSFTIRIDRRFPFNPDVLVWTFDGIEPIDPITLDVGSTEVVINEGESINQSYTVSYTAVDASNKTIMFSQQITPVSGLQLTTDAPASWSSSSTIDWIVNGTLSSTLAGQYTLTIMATILETGEMATVDKLITVLSINQPAYNLHEPLMSPSGIQVNQAAQVFFGAQLDIENGAPAALILEETDSLGNLIQTIGLLQDNGLDGDVVANDRMYGATFLVDSNTEGKKYYRTSFFDGNQIAYSTLTALPVVDFPTTAANSNPDMLIESDDPLVQVYADHIVVSFNDWVTSTEIKQVVQAVGGEIIGSIPDLNIVQIGFAQKTLPELQAIIDAYTSRPEVEFAELSSKTETGAVYPNDKGSLNNMKVSRVDEIWLLATGGNAIAIVDTGVDYNHDDLVVLKGKDFLQNDGDPMDEHGHGTHVAGTAAAIINNNKDVAGVSDSTIVAVRAIGGSNEELADAIKYAATKARVINISGGSYDGSSIYEKVTKELGTKVIVGIAHNNINGLEKKNYPCANTNVFCVGNSTDSDNRSATSNYGSWVDIAAPGENVLSTKLGGGKTTLSGTSMAAPLVAGVARVIWNQHPKWSAAEVKKRLLDTAFDAPDLKGKLIGKRIDAFEALFNGDFELDLKEWTVEGTCESKTKLGPIVPKSGLKFAFCTTGPAGDQVAATLTKELNFVADSDFTIKFWYNVVSEEYPEYVGSVFDDSLKIKLVAPDGTETILAQESINSSNFEPVTGIDFEGGDDTVGQLLGGWKEVSKTIPVKKGVGSYKILIEDAGDDIYDTAVLLDNIRLK